MHSPLLDSLPLFFILLFTLLLTLRIDKTINVSPIFVFGPLVVCCAWVVLSVVSYLGNHRPVQYRGIVSTVIDVLFFSGYVATGLATVTWILFHIGVIFGFLVTMNVFYATHLIVTTILFVVFLVVTINFTCWKRDQNRIAAIALLDCTALFVVTSLVLLVT